MRQLLPTLLGYLGPRLIRKKKVNIDAQFLNEPEQPVTAIGLRQQLRLYSSSPLEIIFDHQQVGVELFFLARWAGGAGYQGYKLREDHSEQKHRLKNVSHYLFKVY